MDRLLANLVWQTDFEGPRLAGAIRTPVGARLTRLAFSPGVQERLQRGELPAELGVHPLPQDHASLVGHFRRKTGIGGDSADDGLHRLMGFTIADVASWLLEVRSREDGQAAYRLLLSLEFRLAAKHFPWIAAPDPRFGRIAGGGLGAITALAEFERAAAIVGELILRSLLAAAEQLTVKLLRVYSDPAEAIAALDRDDGAARFLRDHFAHFETLRAFLCENPNELSTDEALRRLKAGDIGWDDRSALAHDDTRGWKRDVYQDSWRLTPDRYGKGSRRRGKNVAFFYGLGPVLCAAVAVAEITNTAEPFPSVRGRKEGDVVKHVAHDVLTKALVGKAARDLVRRMDGKSDAHGWGERGENLFSESAALVRHYLPAVGKPGAAARFLPEFWLQPDADHRFWDNLQHKLKAGDIKRSQLSLFARTDRANEYMEELLELAAEFEALYESTKPTPLTALTFAHLATAVSPFSADPWLLKSLSDRRETARREERERRQRRRANKAAGAARQVERKNRR